MLPMDVLICTSAESNLFMVENPEQKTHFMFVCSSGPQKKIGFAGNETKL